eukprot:gnl/Trimastix_PCT/907.p1 GENE.gnl/Trimastix_PCT/907~~gnl/Trimastix_PCT/907.p1  ORF type:complete len:729 (+),score=266.19 gnl/Trimastix_PCT/907:35-2221(+)
MAHVSLTPESFSALQEKVKRDPETYREEVLQLKAHFDSELEILKISPPSDVRGISALIYFLGQVGPCFKKEFAAFPDQIEGLLLNAENLHSDLRTSLVRSMILMHNRKMISSLRVFPLFFQLFRCPDRPLRALLEGHLIADIRRLNLQGRDQKLNRSLQNFVFKMLNDPNPIAVRRSVHVMITLFRKNIWADQRTADVLARACLSGVAKVRQAALRFFLGVDEATEDEEEDEEEEISRSELHNLRRKGVVSSTKRRRKLERARQMLEHAQKMREKKATVPTSRAILLLSDPDGFAERLFSQLQKTVLPYVVRLLHMDLISRLISAHQLFILNFYPYLMRYIRPAQSRVTLILAVTCQSVHDMVPPDVISPLLRHIANEFVRVHRPEVTAAGINAIRQIAYRCPLAMTPELLAELADFKREKDKGVMMASRALIQLFRAVNPHLLPRKERGKYTDMSVAPLAYGQQHVATGVEGVELLAQNEGAELPSDDSDWETEEEWFEPKSDNDSDDSDDDGTADDKPDSTTTDTTTTTTGGKGEGEGEAVKGECGSNSDEEEEDGDEEGEGDGEGDDAMSVVSTSQPQSTAPRIDLLRPLTDLEFERLDRLKKRATLEQLAGTKRSRAMMNAPDLTEAIDPDDIEGYRKPERLTAAQKKTIAASKEKYVHHRKEKKGNSTTNEVKAKAKPLMQVLHSRKMRSKRNRTMKERQVRNRKHQERMRKNKRMKAHRRTS